MTDHAKAVELLREIEDIVHTYRHSGTVMDGIAQRAEEALSALSDERRAEVWRVVESCVAFSYIVKSDDRNISGLGLADAEFVAAQLNRLPRLERAAREVVGGLGPHAGLKGYRPQYREISIHKLVALRAALDEEPSR